MNPEGDEARKDLCRCGRNVDDPAIVAVARYRGFGWLLFVIGVTPTPTQIDFVCPVCRHLFESSNAPDVCLRYKFRSS
jgi:hypothetical protein